MERARERKREERKNRPRCCLSCRDNIPPKSNSVHKSCWTFFFFFSITAFPLLFLSDDSCLGNRGKSSFCQTDVPFSWKLECVKNPRDANYFKVLQQREGKGGRGEEKKGMERQQKQREPPPPPPLCSSPLVFPPLLQSSVNCGDQPDHLELVTCSGGNGGGVEGGMVGSRGKEGWLPLLGLPLQRDGVRASGKNCKFSDSMAEGTHCGMEP